MEVTESADPEGLRVFYYLVQDLKALVFSLISLHFKVSCQHRKQLKVRVLTASSTDQADMSDILFGTGLREMQVTSVTNKSSAGKPRLYLVGTMGSGLHSRKTLLRVSYV